MLVMLYAALLNNSQSSKQNCQDISSSVCNSATSAETKHSSGPKVTGIVQIPQSLFPLPDPCMSGLDVAGTTVGEELVYTKQWPCLEAKGRNSSSQKQ